MGLSLITVLNVSHSLLASVNSWKLYCD